MNEIITNPDFWQQVAREFAASPITMGDLVDAALIAFVVYCIIKALGPPFRPLAFLGVFMVVQIVGLLIATSIKMVI